MLDRAIENAKLDGEKPDDENRVIPCMTDSTENQFEYKPEMKVIDNIKSDIVDEIEHEDNVQGNTTQENDDTHKEIDIEALRDPEENEYDDIVSQLPTFKNDESDDDLLSQW